MGHVKPAIGPVELAGALAAQNWPVTLVHAGSAAVHTLPEQDSPLPQFWGVPQQPSALHVLTCVPTHFVLPTPVQDSLGGGRYLVTVHLPPGLASERLTLVGKVSVGGELVATVSSSLTLGDDAGRGEPSSGRS